MTFCRRKEYEVFPLFYSSFCCCCCYHLLLLLQSLTCTLLQLNKCFNVVKRMSELIFNIFNLICLSSIFPVYCFEWQLSAESTQIHLKHTVSLLYTHTQTRCFIDETDSIQWTNKKPLNMKYGLAFGQQYFTFDGIICFTSRWNKDKWFKRRVLE